MAEESYVLSCRLVHVVLAAVVISIVAIGVYMVIWNVGYINHRNQLYEDIHTVEEKVRELDARMWPRIERNSQRIQELQGED